MSLKDKLAGFIICVTTGEANTLLIKGVDKNRTKTNVQKV